MRILKSHPLLKMDNSYIIDSLQPANLSSFLTFCLIVQIIAGITLGMHYTPNVLEAFDSVEHIISCDAPEPWRLFFQDDVSPVEGLEELHDSIMFYLAAILFAVSWIIVSIILNHMSKYVVRGSLAELIWTITPPFSLILITLITFKLLYLMDVTASSRVIFDIACILFAVLCIMVHIIWGYPLKDYIYIFEELLRWSIFFFLFILWLSTTWVMNEYPKEFLSFEDIISGGDPIQVVLSEPCKDSSIQVQAPRLLDWIENSEDEWYDPEETTLAELYTQVRAHGLWCMDTVVLWLVLEGYMTIPVANSLIDYVMEYV